MVWSGRCGFGRLRRAAGFAPDCRPAPKGGEDRPVTSDLERLQGRWSQTGFEENGIIDPPDTHGAPGAVLTIRGLTFHVGLSGGETLLEGRFVWGGAASPGAIDWIDSIGEDAGKTIPAIYELAGDRFRFAAADPGLQRPTGFDGGYGITIRAFFRV